MTYVVVEGCIKCKYMDCVEVCPVDCFYEGENMLVIHPDECIDCGVCEPECPVEAIKPDTEPGLGEAPEPQCRIRENLAQHHGQEAARRTTPSPGRGWRTSSKQHFSSNPGGGRLTRAVLQRGAPLLTTCPEFNPPTCLEYHFATP